MKHNESPDHIKVGSIGENLVAKHLKTAGFAILGMNYRKQYGEIDVIAQSRERVHFVEVKTVSHETVEQLSTSVSRETYRPEENVHAGKLRKLSRAIEVWMLENNYEGEWQIDVAAVRIVPREKYATIEMIENVIVD